MRYQAPRNYASLKITRRVIAYTNRGGTSICVRPAYELRAKGFANKPGDHNRRGSDIMKSKKQRHLSRRTTQSFRRTHIIHTRRSYGRPARRSPCVQLGGETVEEVTTRLESTGMSPSHSAPLRVQDGKIE